MGEVFGALTDRDEKADELFNEQVDIVNRIAKTDTAANDDSRPTVAFSISRPMDRFRCAKAQIMCQR